MARGSWLARAAAAVLPLLLAGCIDEPPLPETGVVVFQDGFSTGYTPNAFGGSLLTALTVDKEKSLAGTASIRIDVPSSAADPGFAGGAVLAAGPQDLSGTRALYFWATASRAVTFDKVGFGLNFDPYPSTYQVTLFGLPLTTEWVRHVVPIPDPARLKAERGVFWYAADDPTAYTAWFDEVRFDAADLGALALQPAIGTAAVTIGVGDTAQVGGLALHYTDLDGTRRAVDSTAAGRGPAPQYFKFATSNGSVARVSTTGEILGVGLGTATITATLAGTPAAGAVTVTVANLPPSAPTTAPPAPTLPAASVIALLSKPYAATAVPVDTWGTDWSNSGAGAGVTDVTIGGDPMKRYPGMVFVGIEFIGPPTGTRLIDATGMTHFHVDAWSPDATTFKVKLVDFGANKAFGGGDDSEHELVFGAGTTPAVVAGQWLSFDLPLASFTGLASRAHLAQLVLSSSGATVFVDNVYFHR